MHRIHRLSSIFQKTLSNLPHKHPSNHFAACIRRLSTGDSVQNSGEDEWNDAWETAWLPPDDLAGKNNGPPWESGNNLSLSSESNPSLSSEMDGETRAFVEDMNDNWEHRRNRTKAARQDQQQQQLQGNDEMKKSLYGLESIKRDYRLKKQRIHAGLWVKEIEKQEEARLMGGDGVGGAGDDIERLLDSCSEIFDTANTGLDNSKIPSSTELRNKPDGWETTAKAQDGSVWEMSQREEDVLQQEFERRIAFCKFQIASFIKTHIFSRRRPIDGWKYMIEEIGPNARKGKGSVSRIPSLADEATQPFREERTPISSNPGYIKGR